MTRRRVRRPIDRRLLLALGTAAALVLLQFAARLNLGNGMGAAVCGVALLALGIQWGIRYEKRQAVLERARAAEERQRKKAGRP